MVMCILVLNYSREPLSYGGRIVITEKEAISLLVGATEMGEELKHLREENEYLKGLVEKLTSALSVTPNESKD